MIALVIQRTATFTVAEVYTMAQTVDPTKERSIIFDNLSKISDLSMAGVVKLNQLLEYGDKDSLIKLTLPKIPKFTTDELITVARSAYNSGDTVAISYFGQLSDFTPANAVKLAGVLDGGNKDQVVSAWFSRNASVTTSQLISLSAASYNQQSSALINQVTKVSDLTVTNAISLSRRLDGGDKDTFLMKAVALATDLSSANLITLANEAYSRRDAVLQAGINRLAGH